MQQEYKVTLYGQLGPREGRLSIASCGGHISGTLTLMGFENPVTGNEDGGGFTLSHMLRTSVGEHRCRSIFTKSGAELTGTAYLDTCSMRWSGREITCPESMEVDRA